MYILIVVLLIISLTIIYIINTPVFGKKPFGARLIQIKQLPNFKDGAIQNLSPTPMKPDGVSYWKIIRRMMKRNVNRAPMFPLPSIKPIFTADHDTKIIWFGHSSYLLQVNGINILVDPVFSVSASPFSFIGYKYFKGTNFLQPEELPELDVVLITHDHYDHLDYQSILKLNLKTKIFITSLGVGAHLESWNISTEKIKELRWGDEIVVENLKFMATPARHFSGRLIKRNQTLWSSFVLQTPHFKLFLGGDSGYDTHFKEIGDLYGPFDIAILECGQYNSYWPYIHLFPAQTVQAALDLKAKVLMPVHWGKYALALHDWNEPIISVVKAAKKKNLKITTPQLGETVRVGLHYPDYEWWT